MCGRILRMLVECVDQEIKRPGLPCIIRIQENNKLGIRVRLAKTCVPRRSRSAVIASREANTCVLSCQLFGKFERTVPRAVIKQHELPIDKGLRQDALYRGGEVSH